MDTPFVRVLVVDDFEEWRRELRAILEEKPGLRVVGEAANGREAVQQAQALKPDLILLDIGLPVLNGIQVARVIGDSGLQSKILFVSENRRREIAEEGLRTTALGYVIKSQAGSELLPAVDAVLQGKQFVSAFLRAQDPPAGDIGGNSWHEKAVAPLPPQNIVVRHEVAFYADDAGLEAGFARTSRAVLKVKGTVLVIATESHRGNIYRRLQMDGVDLESKIRMGKYIQLDAVETLSKIMIGDLPNSRQCEQLLSEAFGKTTGSAQGEHRRIAICGECAPTLLGQCKLEAAVRLEHIWDEVTGARSADTLCGYVWGSSPDRDTNPVFQRICAEHSAIHGRELGY